MLHPGPAVDIWVWVCANFKQRPPPSERGAFIAQVVATLKGHFDYSFAVAWHPDGNCFATGNQVGSAVLPHAPAAADDRVPRGPAPPLQSSHRRQHAVRKLKVGMSDARLVTQRRFVPQDTTTRVWDVRMTGRGSVAVLKGRIGAIRSLRYSPCGRVLAVAEPADFITLYDVAEGYEQAQEVTH
jgi:WD40 repeat protein